MWTESPTELKDTLSSNTLSWMSKPYRLADALLRVCDQLTVELQFQGVGMYLDDEQHLLEAKDNECYVREVFLYGNGMNLCFARTVMPTATYSFYKDEFDTMSSKLLGKNFLYSKGQGVTRGPFYYAVVDASHPYFKKCLVNSDQVLGARTSVFCIDKVYPLLVTEVFLPNIPLYKAQEAIAIK